MIEETESKGPGATLAAERIARGFERKYISDQINLSETVIANLEDERWDELPPSAYIKGYIRSYAKLLDLEPQPLVDSFSQIESTPVNYETEVTTVEAAQEYRQQSEGSSILVFALIGLLLLLPLAYWLYTQYFSDPMVSGKVDQPQTADVVQDTSLAVDALPERDASVSEAPSGNALQAPTTLSMASDPLADGVSYSRPVGLVDDSADIDLLPMPMVSNSGVVTESAQQTVSSGERDSESEPASESELSESPDTVDTSAEDTAPETVPVDDEAVAVNIEAAPAESFGIDTLQLKASEDSWVSVSDAAEQRLMYGILTNGTPRKLQGRAPFKIVFGAATVVDATLNGDPVDFSSMIRRSKTARFELYSDGSVQRMSGQLEE